MPSLLDHFSPVISEVLDLAVVLSTDEHLDGAAAVRDGLAADVQAAEAAARSELRPDRDIELAGYAVVAWIDEVMLGYPEWGKAAPNLQGELLQTQVARETFFTHLEELGDDQDEVRQVYYLLLCLGFQGYYGELSNGREELERLMDIHSRRLDLAPASAAALAEERLTAQPYGVQPPTPVRRRPTPKPPPPLRPAPAAPKPAARWRWGLILGLILVPLALLLIAGMLLTPGWLRQKVDARLADMDCAYLDGSVGSDRMTTLEGYVSSEAEREILLADVGGMTFMAGTEDDIAVLPWPFCRVLEDAWPRARRSEREGLGAKIGLADPSQPLRNRFLVVVEAFAPAFDGYLYLFYVHSDGGVVPLLPNEMMEENRHVAGQRIALGEEDSPFRLRVAPPFGTDMLLLYAASEPLLDGPPVSYYDDLEQLVDRLRAGLMAVEQAGGQTAASFSFIETKP